MVKKTNSDGDGIIGFQLNNLKEIVISFSNRGNNILLVGPRGVGKELFARLYQAESGRNKFVPINCTGISDTNLQSELFGHVRGSFTGATHDRKGLISSYKDNGVILLDEIGDASQSFQAMILRVLQTGDYKKYGSDIIENAKNIRIIAATSKPDLIRDDLKDRFSILYIPELAVWRDDIPQLIRYFCDDVPIKYISEDAISFLKNHPWPGNVRELKKLLNEAVTLCEIRKGIALRKYDFPSLAPRDTLNEIDDQSPKKRIYNLPINKVSLPHSYFFLPIRRTPPPDDPQPMEITNAQLYSIVNVLSGVRTSIDKISENKIVNNPSAKIDFERITPNEYKNFFWEYHAEKGRGGTQIVKHFNGRIPSNKTAAKNLKDARAKLESKKSKGKN
jgi:hypothetical protein